MSGVSLARRVVLLVAGVLVAASGVTGLVTAGLMHAEAVDAIDHELLTAAHAYASGGGAAWFVEHSATDVRVWTTGPGDSRVPAEEIARALADEEPRWLDRGGDRLLLLVTEREHRAREREEEHRVVAAAAPRPTWGATIRGFVAPYVAAAALVTLAVVAALGRLSRIALAPLDRARAAAESASVAGVRARLPEEGPVEVRGLLAAMNALLARLDAAAAAQASFTAEAAHELRTPVTVLLGELDVALRRERDAASLRETLESVREEVARLAAVVEGLLALARVDAGQADTEREALRVSEVAAEAAHREAGTLADAACPLTMDVAADAEVRGNRALLVTALANVLRNAAVHAAGTPVRLRVEGARVVIDDGGPGVPVSEREGAFDRLTRGAAARRHDRHGLGLGLPLTREIARRHGGDCVIEDAPGGGCRVVLTLASGSRAS